MKIIKDSICCKKKEIEKQTGENSNVIMTAAEVQNNPKAFVYKDAMKIICNLDKFNFGKNIYRTGNVKIRGIVTSGSGKKYLGLEYPIFYLEHKNIKNNFNNYANTQVGKFKVLIHNIGYIFEISNLNDKFLDDCKSLLNNPEIKDCGLTEVEEKILNNRTFFYINDNAYDINKLAINLEKYYKEKKSYWNEDTLSCIEFKEMADFSQPNKNDDAVDIITNEGFYKKILTDMNIKDNGDGFMVHLDDVNQKCIIGNNLGKAMGKFFRVETDNIFVPRYVITFKQSEGQYYRLLFKISGDNINLMRT